MANTWLLIAARYAYSILLHPFVGCKCVDYWKIICRTTRTACMLSFSLCNNNASRQRCICSVTRMFHSCIHTRLHIQGLLFKSIMPFVKNIVYNAQQHIYSNSLVVVFFVRRLNSFNFRKLAVRVWWPIRQDSEKMQPCIWIGRFHVTEHATLCMWCKHRWTGIEGQVNRQRHTISCL